MKSAVSSKISEVTDDLWGPTTNLGQMMEASAAVEAAVEQLGVKISKRELVNRACLTRSLSLSLTVWLPLSLSHNHWLHLLTLPASTAAH